MNQVGVDELEDDADCVAQVLSLQSGGKLAEAQRRFETLYRRHAAAVLARLSAAASRRQAEDLAQETWMRAWKRLDSFTKGSFRAWILTIATNCRTDWYRRPPLRLLTDDGAVPDGSARTAEEESDHEERARILRDCLAKLDERRRKVIVALLYEESEYKVLCDELGITADAAYKLTHEGKRLLTDCCRRAMK
jgi:RNA polymerase sigma-70 factor, ECF subfamily